MDKMYNYYFHFNPHTELWAAFKRTEEKDYMDKMYPYEGSKALFATDIQSLFEVIASHNPNIEDRGFKRDH